MSERKRTGGWDNVREEVQEDFRRKIKRLDVKGSDTRERERGRGKKGGCSFRVFWGLSPPKLLSGRARSLLLRFA